MAHIRRPGKGYRRQVALISWSLRALLLALVAAGVWSMGHAAAGSAATVSLTPLRAGVAPLRAQGAAPSRALLASVRMVSPSSGQGPVGATITLSGSGFLGGHVTISAAQGSCGNPLTPALGSAATSGGGFTTSFSWPGAFADLSQSYLVCASSGLPTDAASANYRVLSASAPALTVTPGSASAGQPVTITGSAFAGGSTVSLALTLGGKTQPIPGGAGLTPDASGAFSLTYTPDGSSVGAAQVVASSAPENGAPPALQAQAPLTLLAASSGATPNSATAAAATASATAGAAQTAGAGGTPGTRAGAGAPARNQQPTRAGDATPAPTEQSPISFAPPGSPSSGLNLFLPVIGSLIALTLLGLVACVIVLIRRRQHNDKQALKRLENVTRPRAGAEAGLGRLGMLSRPITATEPLADPSQLDAPLEPQNPDADDDAMRYNTAELEYFVRPESAPSKKRPERR